jgi:hypothetical protein
MRLRTSSATALAVASIFLITGCSFGGGGGGSASDTVSSDDIADLAEEWLEDDIDDSSWSVNCDDDDEEVDVDLEEDESIDCLATDKDSDLEYDAEVTITEVDGEDFEVEVELADDANNEEDEEEEENTDDNENDNNGDTYYISDDEMADLAVDALTEPLGYAPTDMICLASETEIYVGNYDYCYFTGDDDEFYTVEVTIDTFDEDTGEYTVIAEVIG